MVFSLSAFWWRKVRGLWKLPDGREWPRGKLGLILMDGAMLSKSLIQFSIEGWGCVPSVLFDLRSNYGGGNEGNETSFKWSLAHTATLSATNPVAGHCWPMPLPETPGHLRTSLGQSLLGSQLLSPGSWCTQVSICALQESISPVPCKSLRLYCGVNGDLLQEGLCRTQLYCTQSLVFPFKGRVRINKWRSN